MAVFFTPFVDSISPINRKGIGAGEAMSMPACARSLWLT